MRKVLSAHNSSGIVEKESEKLNEKKKRASKGKMIESFIFHRLAAAVIVVLSRASDDILRAMPAS